MNDLPMILFSNLSVRDAAYEIVLADMRRQLDVLERQRVEIERERSALLQLKQ